ncbi:MipA/OmpV family protein [Algicella marina]|uniref:MipA/OmpV family protein n=1 Tax=Algicella marina TaxID=2683284 RepID=UPI001379F147|nr:MipA/OmpV family protein [Algicella marina]
MLRLANLCLAILALAAPAAAQEDSLPLWEIRTGAFGLYAPDYPASGNYRLNGLAYPNIQYRGEFIRLGGSAAARLVPVDNPRYEIGISLDASFAANSDDNELREGMPDLGYLFELGPEFILHGPTFNTGSISGKLDFALQGRAVFSADLDEGIGYEGLVLEPAVRYEVLDLLGEGSRIRASIGPIFATERLHDYFYEVAPGFAAPGRPAYDAEGGYLGTEASLGVSLPLSDRFRLFGGLGLGYYAGAANTDSPLYEEDLNGYVFFGGSVTLFESRRKVVR